MRNQASFVSDSAAGLLQFVSRSQLRTGGWKTSTALNTESRPMGERCDHVRNGHENTLASAAGVTEFGVLIRLLDVVRSSLLFAVAHGLQRTSFLPSQHLARQLEML